MNIDILGISELKWTGMGDFNSDDHYIYYCDLPTKAGDAGDIGLIPGWGRSPGGGNGYPLEYS